MAELSTDPNGLRRIRFYDDEGERRQIRLGRMPLKNAKTFLFHVDRLVWAQSAKDTPEPDTATWVNELDKELREKLEAVGLVRKRKKPEALTVLAWVDRYVAGRNDAKPATLTVYGHTRRNLADFFGESKLLRDVTEGDASEFRMQLRADGLGDNTVRRRIGYAKQFFHAAIRKRLIDRNPFDGLASTVQPNRARQQFVTPAEIAKVMEQCPNSEWKCLIALVRFAGLRNPSETLLLKWSDIDWANGRMLVTSPKTEHIGKGTRVVPIFAELLPYLRDASESAPDGAEYVIARYRRSDVNLRTQLLKFIERAGLTPWPRLWHNLRASRQTELVERFPAHVVAGWLGNTKEVAESFYLQTTEEHFDRAAKAETDSVAPPVAPNGAKPDETGERDQQKNPGKTLVFRGTADSPMVRAGANLPTKPLKNKCL